jgi:hypothetical protein
VRLTVSVAAFAVLITLCPAPIGGQSPHGTRNQVAGINNMPYADAFPDSAGLFQPYGNDLQQIQKAMTDCPPSGCTVIIPAYMTGAAGDWTSGVSCNVPLLIQDFRGGTVTYGAKGTGTTCVITTPTGTPPGTVTSVGPSSPTTLDGLLSYGFTNSTTTPVLSLTLPANTAAPSYWGVTGSTPGTAAFVQPQMADLVGAPFALHRVFWITTSQTYTPTTGTRALYVECIGGGGGGGSANTTSANASAAGGGASGAYAASFISAPAGSYVVTIGGGGIGGTAGSVGGPGADTTLGAVLTAKAGSAGAPGTTAGSGPAISLGGTVQSGSIGDITMAAAAGGQGIVISATVAIAGNGGGGIWGGEGNPIYVVTSGSAAGRTTSTYGGGGPGAANVGTQGTAQAGAAGNPGACRVWEFF